MSKLICMGECLIDFMPQNTELTFTGKAGGAPTNVCASVGKLGGESYYLGCMANDNFGKFLYNKLQKCNVKTDYITFTDNAGTGLAFVTLDSTGDRSFTFYRNPSADMLLDKNLVKEEYFDKGDVLHFCSVALVDSPTKEAHKKAIEIASKKGTYISFDVNLRLNIWNDDIKCISVVKEFLQYADIVKVTDEELAIITGISDMDKAIQKLFYISINAKLIFVTMGEKGARVFDRNTSFFVDSVKTKVVDTTGAGDCFSGVIIYNILNRKNKDKHLIKIDEVKDATIMAAKACSIVVARQGAMESMPTLKEIEEL